MAHRQKRKEIPFEKREAHAYKSRTDPPQHMVIASLTDTWNGPGEVFERDGVVYERTDHIEIDVNQIPKHVRERFIRTVLKSVEEHFQQPGAEEEFQAWLKERNRIRAERKREEN